MTRDGELNRLMKGVTGFQEACLLIAAAELDLWTELYRSETGRTVSELASALRLDERGLAALLDALLPLDYLEKKGEFYLGLESWHPYLDSASPETMIPMIRHWGTCQRAWSQLGQIVKTGTPVPMVSGVLGPLEENAAFLWGMNSLAVRTAPPLTEKMKNLGLLRFKKMIDFGGASGTWTLAFLRACPEGEGIILDLPMGIDEAKKRLAKSENADVAPRISFYAGDFYRDPFPQGGDFHWFSAIIHQQNSETTRTMFARSYESLLPGGRIAVRDHFPTEKKPFSTEPALFNVNMLTRTESGKVYRCEETLRLLEEVGFKNPRLAVPADDMTAVIVAEKG